MSILSQFSTKPRRSHWLAAPRVLRYVHGTLSYGINYSGGDILVGYSDADLAGCIDTCRSTLGYCFMLGGGIISWKSQKQRITSSSSTEAEYKAYLDATSKALWLQQILSHLGCLTSTSTTLYSDSQSAIALAKNPIVRGRSKHIDVHFHFVLRDYIADGRIRLEYCPTKDNIADLLTKPLPQPSLDHLLQRVGVGPSIWS